MKKSSVFFIVAILIFLDQLTKFLIDTNMYLHQKIVIIDNFFTLEYIKNDGAAFSILSGKMFLFYIITILALILVGYFFKTSKSKLSLIASSFLLSGILGNFIDRLVFQEVTDFLSFQFNGYHFAVFNFADMYISVAVVLFFIDYFVNERKNKDGRNKSRNSNE